MKNKKLIIVLAFILFIGGLQYYNAIQSRNKGDTEDVVAEQLEVTPEPLNIVKPKQVIIDDLDNLIKAEPITISKYFGNSDIYRGIDVADRIAIAKVTFISINSKGTEIYDNLDSVEGVENGKMTVNMHVCTLDYNKTKEQVQSLTELNRVENPSISEEELSSKVTTQVAERAQKGDMDIHINIPIDIVYEKGEGRIVITEAFKSAITGGWFNPTGLNMESIECPLNKIEGDANGQED